MATRHEHSPQLGEKCLIAGNGKSKQYITLCLHDITHVRNHARVRYLVHRVSHPASGFQHRASGIWRPYLASSVVFLASCIWSLAPRVLNPASCFQLRAFGLWHPVSIIPRFASSIVHLVSSTPRLASSVLPPASLIWTLAPSVQHPAFCFLHRASGV